MIGILDRDPDGYSPYIIICLIQARSSPAVNSQSFSSPDSLQANPSIRLIFHMPCMYMWRIFKETFGTGKRSDAVHSDVKFASASFIVMLLIHNLKKIMMLPRPSSGTSGRSARRWWIRRGVVHREHKLYVIEGCN